MTDIPQDGVLHIKNLSKSYRMGETAVHALNDVSFSVLQGEFVAITGTSGSGKSTLLHLIGMLDRPESGGIYLADTALSELDDFQLASVRNKTFGFLFQSYNLLPGLTALENVEAPLIYAEVSAEMRRVRATAALEKLGLGDRLHHRPHELSGGQQQRVAAARAIVNNPSIILADEPTGALDSETAQNLMQSLIQINKTGPTVILVTHDETIAAQATRQIHLSDGRVIKDSLSI